MRPSPLLLGHLLEGPALRDSLGAEVQQRLGPAPAAHSPGPGITLLRSSGAAPAALGRGGVHPAGPGPGPGRGLLGWGGVGPMSAPLRRLQRPLPVFRSLLSDRPFPDPRRSHPRPAPGRPGDAAPLSPFTTMKLLRPPLYPPPSSRPRRPVPIGTPVGFRDPPPPLEVPPDWSPSRRCSFVICTASFSGEAQ